MGLVCIHALKTSQRENGLQHVATEHYFVLKGLSFTVEKEKQLIMF